MGDPRDTEALEARIKSWNRCYPGNINIEMTMDDALAAIQALRSQLAEMEVENGRLREALEPFARMGELIELETTGFSDDDELHLIVETGHLMDRFSVKSFRQALASKEGGRG